MLEFSESIKNCMACSACVSICPTNSINMNIDEEGFRYPSLNQASCIHCGLCEKVCPVQTGYEGHREFNDAFAFKSTNYQVWKRSSSGGAFTEICKVVNPNSYIFGAEWNGDTVRHNYVKGVEGIGVFNKSKYIESDLNTVFTETKDLLEKGEYVVFSGLPCQIAGLKNFLKQDYDNLLTIDLICHGVGSPSVFKSCLKVLAEDLNIDVENYEFRAKTRFYEKEYIISIKCTDEKQLYLSKDRYMELFLKQLCLRPSCGGNCHFRSEKRPGDITIADFKGLYEVFPQLRGTRYNYSAIIPNSEKGMDIVKKVTGISRYQCGLEEIKTHNPLFFRQTWVQENRDQFFQEYCDANIDAIKKWTEKTEIYHLGIKDMIYQALPVSLRRALIDRRMRNGCERK